MAENGNRSLNVIFPYSVCTAILNKTRPENLRKLLRKSHLPAEHNSSRCSRFCALVGIARPSYPSFESNSPYSQPMTAFSCHCTLLIT